MQQFNASVIISEQLNRLMVNAAQELAQRAVSACAEHYKFDAEEAIGLLGLNNVKLERKGAVKDEEVKVKVVMPKPKFPLPYNGEFNDTYCYALRQNNGLYTQCSGVRGNAQFCKSCAKQMQKTGSDMPEYGTIQQRQAVNIFEYVDPNGRKPIAYIKLMKKYKLTQEAVLEEAGKFNIIINNEHFIAPEEETKRGRRKNEDKTEEKQKGVKGRPKKEKKVLQLEGDDDDEDLFAALVQEANNNAQEEDDVSQSQSSSDVSQSSSTSPKKNVVSDEETEEETYERLELEALKEQEKREKAAKKEQERVEREAKKKAEEEEKAEKAAKKEQERIEREAKKKAEEEEKAAKAAKKEQERIEREAKKKAEEEEKAAKAAKKEQERIEREAKKKAEEEEKAAKKSSKKEKEVKPANEEEEDDDEDDEEPDIVKKIEHDGKKYLKSKKTGIIYDYTKYIKDGEQIKVGRWNEKTNKIDFQENDEESEEEYDE